MEELVDVADVVLHRVFGNEELVSDFAVAQARR